MRNADRYIILSAGQEWNAYSWQSLNNSQSIDFIEDLNIFPNKILRKLWCKSKYRTRFLVRIFWEPIIRRLLKLDSRDTIIIVYDWNRLTHCPYLFKLIKKRYPNIRIVYCFTNIIKITGAKKFGLLSSLKETYDQIFAFDKEDSKKYGFDHSNLIYTPIIYHNTNDKISKYDLFYVGQAKDRLDKLIQIFKHAKSEGLKCKFFITGVEPNDMYEDIDITYNHQLPYGEVLEYIKQSTAIVDAIQSDSTGLTIKTCEAVLWGKKLITTNLHVELESFFHKSNILIYTSESQLKNFISLPFIPYNEKDIYEFSPNRLFSQIL